jgi:hypothetical protein
VDESNLLSERRGDLLGGNEHFESPGAADEAGEALGSAPSGDEAEGGAAVSEDGVRVGDAEVAGEGEVESAAHAVTVNGGANRGGEVVDKLHEALAHPRELEAVGRESGDFVEVGSGGEEPVVAGDDERARIAGKVLYRFR